MSETLFTSTFVGGGRGVVVLSKGKVLGEIKTLLISFEKENGKVRDVGFRLKVL